MNILIVDDEPVIRNGARHILTRKGHSTILCKDAESALKIIDKQTFDLVIVDYLLPGANGLELVHIVKKQAPETVILLISGFITEKTIVSGFSAGIFDFLPKPFTRSEFLFRITRAERRTKLDITPFREAGASKLFFGEHTWIEKSSDDIRKVGIDVRFARTIENIESVHVKQNETSLQQGGYFFNIFAEDNDIQIFSPVSGLIHSWNPIFLKDFKAIFSDPFDENHWIVKVKLTGDRKILETLHEFEGDAL